MEEQKNQEEEQQEKEEKGYSIGRIREYLKKQSFLKELVEDSFLTEDQITLLLWRHLNKDADESYEKYDKRRRKTSARMINSKAIRKIQKAYMTLYNVPVYSLLPELYLSRLKNLIHHAFEDQTKLVKQYYNFVRGKEHFQKLTVLNFEKTKEILGNFDYKSTFLTEKQALYLAFYSWNYYHGIIHDIAKYSRKNYDTVRKEIKKGKKNVQKALATVLFSLYINDLYDVFSDAFEFLEEIVTHSLTYSDPIERFLGMDIYNKLMPALSKKIKMEVDGRRKYLLEKLAKIFSEKKGTSI